MRLSWSREGFLIIGLITACLIAEGNTPVEKDTLAIWVTIGIKMSGLLLTNHVGTLSSRQILAANPLISLIII